MWFGVADPAWPERIQRRVPSDDGGGFRSPGSGTSRPNIIAEVFADRRSSSSGRLLRGPADGSSRRSPGTRGGLRGMARPGVSYPGTLDGGATSRRSARPSPGYWEQAEPQHPPLSRAGRSPACRALTSFLGRSVRSMAGRLAVFTHGIFGAVACIADRRGDPGPRTCAVAPLHQPLPSNNGGVSSALYRANRRRSSAERAWAVPASLAAQDFPPRRETNPCATWTLAREPPARPAWAVGRTAWAVPSSHPPHLAR